MNGHYSQTEKASGRKWWLTFSLLNTLSFQFLAGNVILLFIMRLGATKTLVGLVSSFFHISYFIMPLGRKLSRKVGIARGFTLAWALRYIAISPMLLAPFIAMGGSSQANTLAIAITVGGYFGFQMLRGAGLVSLSPLLTEISMGEDRGKYLSISRLLTDTAILTGSLIVAFYLGEEAPLQRYLISFLVGIALGYLGVFTLSRIPEITRPEGHKDEELKESLRSVWENGGYRQFFLTLLLVGFVGGALRPFLLVYARDLYNLNDSSILLLTVAGSFGAIIMGIISRRFLDYLGAKPMLMIWIVLMFTGCVAIVFMPLLAGWGFWLFLSGLFFISMMGLNGSINTTQTYFFSMIDAEQQLNFGILQFLATGISGAVGGSLGGVFLDLLQGPGALSPRSSHVSLFGILAVLLGVSFVSAGKMERLGALSLKQSLSELFSIKTRTRGQG